MESDRLLEELNEVLERRGISLEMRDLSDNELNIRSGLCVVDLERRLIVDRRLPEHGRIEFILKILRSEELDTVFMPPAVREIIESCRD